MAHVLSISKMLTMGHRTPQPVVQSRTITSLASRRPQAVTRRVARVSRFNWLGLLAAVLVFGNVTLLGLHVVQANRYAVKGYEITALRNNIARLQEDNKKLSLRLSENTSIVGVQQVVAEKRFVPITVTEFIKAGSPVSIK